MSGLSNGVQPETENGITARGVPFQADFKVDTSAVNVDCGKCVACCKRDAIFLKPEYGDDISKYKVEYYQGLPIIAHQYNGDCFYLDRKKGCTIYDDRPFVCRRMDCAVIILENPKVYRKLASPEVIRAGKKRLKRLKEQVRRRRAAKKAKNK